MDILYVFSTHYITNSSTVRVVNAFSALKDPKEEAKEAEVKASTEVKEKPKEKEEKDEKKCATLRFQVCLSNC